MTANRAKLEALRARLWTDLQKSASPVVLNGPEIGAPDVVPTTLNVSFPGCRADLLLVALDLAGVACCDRVGVFERLAPSQPRSFARWACRTRFSGRRCGSVSDRRLNWPKSTRRAARVSSVVSSARLSS